MVVWTAYNTFCIWKIFNVLHKSVNKFKYNSMDDCLPYVCFVNLTLLLKRIEYCKLESSAYECKGKFEIRTSNVTDEKYEYAGYTQKNTLTNVIILIGLWVDHWPFPITEIEEPEMKLIIKVQMER